MSAPLLEPLPTSLSRLRSPSVAIAQLTDTHLFADAAGVMLGCQTRRSLEQVLAQLAQLPQLDLLLLTGDLSQDDSPESYQALHAAITPFQRPTYWIPGNHDQNTAMTEDLLGEPPFSHQQSFCAGGWRFLLLSTLLPEQVSGRLSVASLDWFAAELAADPPTPTLVALHHHPLPIGSAWMDAIALENPEDLFAVIDRHSQVKLVIHGHIHQEFVGDRNGVAYLGAPSTCVQFQPRSPKLILDDQQPGFRLLLLFADGTHQTQIIRCNPPAPASTAKF
ncbi:MAG: 3',5'-cyclic-AMP phosphodiesterase [Synechococcales cyanobacterium RU_4_20]|nr:3',5'-cyclic-AMP phosphodiesterase [Synechococcales cyanobacterium RU_4_20]